MLNLLKALLSKPYFTPVLVFLAASASLLIGYRMTHHRPLSPLAVLHQDTLDTTYGPGYWAALAGEQPDLYQSALLYCIGHQARPNCEALRRQAFTTSLEHSATATPPPLEPAAVPLEPTSPAARPR